MSDEYDSPWKNMLARYFPSFMAFFFPDAHADIDWSRGYESLDTELQKVVREAETGKRLADKLMKVWRCNGEMQVVFIHIEVQGNYDTKFAERMFIYHYRLYDRYHQSIVSLAVLSDISRSWRPDQYQTELWGCELGLRFPVAKLNDYQARWDELETSQNPFALVVMAHLKTQSTQKQPEERLRWKFHLVKRLYETGYSREDLLELFCFIDWLLVLPEGLAQSFQDQLKEYEVEMNTPYVTSIERQGIAKGRVEGRIEGRVEGREEGLQQGLEQGLNAERRLLYRLIYRRFGERSAEQIAPLLERLGDPDQLAEIGEWVIDCETGERLLAQIQTMLE